MKTAQQAADVTGQAKQAAEVGDFGGAAELFQRAIVLNPSSAQLHEQLAQCLAELADYTAAEQSALQCVTLDSEWAEGWRTLARIQLNTGNVGHAVHSYAACMERADAAERDSIAAELQDADALWEQQIARRVGLDSLRIQQQLGSSAGPGAVVWESGLCLAEYLVKHDQGWLQGSRVLELGSGTGVVGITAALLGAHLLLTDKQEMQTLLRANLQRSGVSAKADVLDWEVPDAATAALAFDLILAADPVYSAAQIPGFANALSRISQNSSGCRLLIAYKHRHDSVDEAFWAAVRQLDWVPKQIAVSAVDSRVRVFECRQQLHHPQDL